MTTRKNSLKKFHVRPFFPFLSVRTNRLLYQLRKPLIHGFPARKGPSSKLGMEAGMNPQEQFTGILLLRLCPVLPDLLLGKDILKGDSG